MANIMMVMMELQMVTLIGTSLKTVSLTTLGQQLQQLLKLSPSSLAPELNIFNLLDFLIVLNMTKLVKPMKEKKVTSHSK